ncbi:MAG: acyl-CoA desaturase [Xanthomonadales bacterium]|nr:acyl-CoA desaturase [Xanthomonadales bacterium]
MVRLATRPHTRSRSARLSSTGLIALLHLLPIVAIAAGPSREDWLWFAAIYPFQAIGVGVCLHRYFAHNAFKTGRVFQFVLALFCASTFGDPVRFAGKHRLHHLHTDRRDDPHSPRHGFWFSWFGSHVDSRYTDEEICAQVPGLTRYPELMWLHRHSLLPGLLLCLAVFLAGGFSAMAIGVLLGAALLLHQSSAVNYVCHRFGRRRFETDDLSTNHVLVSLLVFGEGWHNNHHRYPVSARAGFRWWEIDMFYWVICGFEILGLVWDVRRPPPDLLRTPLLRRQAG